MTISLITSLYRSEHHLESYSQHVLFVAAQLRRAGLVLETVIVANDASEQERCQIESLLQAASEKQIAAVVPLYIPRETLYASWNRGVRASSGEVIGFWNVDDVRYAEAIIEGARLLARGCNLVDFRFMVVQSYKRFGFLPAIRRYIRQTAFHPQNFSRKNGIGPFSLIARSLYEQVGPFDEHFRIVGDLEWGGRAMAWAKFCPGEEIGGAFHLHGGNLSSTRNQLQDVEDNVVFLRRGQWDELRPVDPDLMRKVWTAWGDQGLPVPGEVQTWLWGDQARANWQRWLRQRQRQAISETLRTFPRGVINRSGMRPYLARLGIVKPNADQG